MQRSFSYQNALSQLLLVGAFVVYTSLSTLYLFLPPLLAVLFLAFYKALTRHDLFGLLIVIAMLLIFEAEKGFWFGSTIIFFTFLSRLLIPKIEQIVQCRPCMASFFVALAYPGYWVFVWLTNQIFLLELPAMDWHIVLYMAIEFLAVVVFI
ncbi:hypothetical protein [Sulfuricurvum sp.]|uniref:hypothetical protein n=1 Tax=Sulfuricurvum sp. TaxID=2025608 RepID=UPI00356B2E17